MVWWIVSGDLFCSCRNKYEQPFYKEALHNQLGKFDDCKSSCGSRICTPYQQQWPRTNSVFLGRDASMKNVSCWSSTVTTWNLTYHFSHATFCQLLVGPYRLPDLTDAKFIATLIYFYPHILRQQEYRQMYVLDLAQTRSEVNDISLCRKIICISRRLANCNHFNFKSIVSFNNLKFPYKQFRFQQKLP